MRITNAELRTELEASVKQGRMTEEFAEMVCHIAQGHIAKHFPEQKHLHHDFISAFHEAIVRNWKKIDKDRNIHAYISTMVSKRALNVIRSDKKYGRRKFDARMLRDTYILKSRIVI